ncbi:hypothetical protein QWI17_02515 [Gilvimarinus sp. SDUM040013]|uniref:Solute-binding protein family 3/N-terminal domain-containing protein n=1 Tax=Gilvimarinus gilvus TaxID=3058038 RepID=A0ABU4S1L2_9GAMM|nr:hypothetical protein [Gilvimarinus sp. SDUM040013]MDO3384706.1 hypothetical protein [Gilvimarinus sp. SDUM040013]MDX6850819.1 hypothetical protein [Gilvimarinus sp. SDUM040013]
MKLKWYTLLLIALMATPVLAHEDEAKTIRFTCSVPSAMPQAQVLEQYYHDAFAEMGYHFSMDYRPDRRSLAEAVSGASHGDCARIPEALTDKELAHVVPVDVVIGQTFMSIWGADAGKQELDHIIQPENTICYVDGNYSARFWVNKLKQRYSERAPKFFKVPDFQSAIRMLTLERATHCLGVEVIFRNVVQQVNAQDSIHENLRLGQIEASPLIHKHHAHLIEPFTVALRKIIDERGIIGANAKQ